MTNAEQIAAKNAVDCVIRLLDGHKDYAVHHLFQGCDDNYQREWLKRDTFRFWTHLDSLNQTLLIRMAVKYYNSDIRPV